MKEIKNKAIGIITGIAMIIALAGFSVSTGDILNSVQPTVEAEELSYDNAVQLEPAAVETSVTSIAVPVVNGFVNEEPVEAEPIVEPDYVEYTVQYGDSLWGIAQHFYGSGYLYTSIEAYNEMDGIVTIHPGDVIKIPSENIVSSEELQKKTAIIEKEIEEEEEVVAAASVSTYNDTPYGPSSFDGNLDFDSAVALLKDGSSLDTTGMEYVGSWKITGYDPHCAHCCGKTNGITASGNQAEFGTTVGSNSLPLGTKIYIEGYGVFRVDDRGGNSRNHIDIACPSHEVCYQMTGNANIYVISYPS